MTDFIVNYIDVSERSFRDSAAISALNFLWSTDETIESDSVVYQDVSFGSIRASGASEVNVYYNIWSDPLNDVPSQFAITNVDDIDDGVESFIWVRPTHNCTVSVKTIITKAIYNSGTNKYMLSDDPSAVIEGEFGSKTIVYGANDSVKWNLVRAQRLAIPQGTGNERYSIGLRIRIVYESTVGVANISRPTITMLNDLFLNPFTQETVAVTPDVFLGQDFIEDDNSVSFPLLRLMEICSGVSGDVQKKFESIQYLDSETNFDSNQIETYSTLISPLVAETVDNLKWLSHFRGRELLVTYEPSTEGEEWTEFVLDFSQLDETHVLASTSIPTSGVSGGTDAYFRWQVETGFYGHNAGTVTAIISAVQLLLAETKYVNYSFSPNQMTIETKIGETFGSDTLSIGDSNPFVLQVIEPARPLGLAITHTLVA